MIVYIALSWLFGILFALLALLVGHASPIEAIPLVLAALLLLPPVRAWFFKKTNKALSMPMRAFLVIVLVTTFGTVANLDQLDKQAIEADNKRRADNLQHFKTNRPAILERIRSAVDAGDYARARSTIERYQDAKDPDLARLEKQITSQTDKAHLADQRQRQIAAQFSPWDGSHLKLERLIKQSMNDPGSYEHVKTTSWDMGDHLIVSTTFRGKNAFGGIVKNTVKARAAIDGSTLAVIDAQN